MGGRASRDLLFIVLVLAGCAVPTARAGGVVGSGTAASCTEAALDSALAGGDCHLQLRQRRGRHSHHVHKLLSTSTTIDGTGQQVTLDGGGSTKQFQMPPQFSPGLTRLQLTLRNGWATDQARGSTSAGGSRAAP
jgi:hypothetical protein